MVKTNKKTIAPDERLRQFTRRIEESGHGRFRSYDTFRWLLVASLARFSVPLAETVPDDAAPLVEDLVNAFHELVGDHPPFTDLLGPVYMELAAHGSKSILSQYFSPQTISAFMGEVLVADNDPPKDHLITACDPPAGSGVMMLAFLTAPSKGQFHREHIRDAYTYRKVSDAALMDLSDYELFSGVFSLIGAESTGLWF
jgi:hypothetical protein